MSDTSANNKRIAKNTIMLYIRLLITLVVGLYTSRIVLATLGISDYGLYNVVGGVVAMFGFLNGALTSSTQRFLNFEIGKNEDNNAELVFSTALCQHVLLMLAVLFLAETIGLWFVLNKLNFETGRETAALWCYQFSVLTACVQIFQLPFMSAIIAHEKMNIYAYVSLFDVTAKLIIVFVLKNAQGDRLIIYSALLLMVTIISSLIYNIYAQKKFSEVRISFKTKGALFKEMISFSGWNILGSLASTLNNYGLNVLFNLFFGTVVNAARGVSYQVSGLVAQFSNNFQIAAKPQVVKYCANHQYEQMKDLVFSSARFSSLLLLLFSVPIAVECEYVLHTWLGEYPEHTPSFIRIILANTILNSISCCVIMAVHASGKLKMIAITAGLANLFLLPINYILLHLGCVPETALCVNLLGSVCETFLELFWLNRYIKFPILEFYLKVYLYVLLMSIIMLFFPVFLHFAIPWESDIVRFIVVSSSSVIFSFCIFYRFGMTEEIRYRLKNKLFSYIK